MFDSGGDGLCLLRCNQGERSGLAVVICGFQAHVGFAAGQWAYVEGNTWNWFADARVFEYDCVGVDYWANVTGIEGDRFGHYSVFGGFRTL